MWGECMGKITKIKTQSHEEWKELRSHYIGGSDAAAVVGLNPFASAYSLWAEKTGRVPGFEGNLATEVGSFLEEFVAKKFEAETGKKVRRVNQSFFNSDYPWAIANIDRDILGEDAGLEIKTTSALNLKRFRGGEYPANYYCQCVHYMAITGKQRWYLAVLIGNRDFQIFCIERDEDEIAALMAAEEAFWQMVQEDTPPAMDGTDATTETLTTIYADSNDECVDLFGCDTDLAAYVALGKRIKELKEEQAGVANRIKALMGEAGRGECQGFKVSWTTSPRRTFDAKRFAEENPGMDLSGYYNETSTRTFRVTEQKGA